MVKVFSCFKEEKAGAIAIGGPGAVFWMWISALLNYDIISESSVDTINLIIGVIITLLVGAVLLGGVKRIGKVTEKLVPFMAILYIILGVGVIAFNFKNLPGVFQSIFGGRSIQVHLQAVLLEAFSSV